MATINLQGLDKAAVLAALYNAARPQGMGFLQFDPKPMSAEEARQLLPQGYFDYLKGRVMKVDLRGDELDSYLYDRDNGAGAAQRVIDSLRATSDANSVLIRSQHAAGTTASIKETAEHLGEGDQITDKGDVVEYKLGLSDMAEELLPRLERARRTTKSPLG